VPAPASPNARATALRAARQAIEQGDRGAALDLLGAVARAELPADDLDPVVSEALVATARARHEERDRAALARYRQAQDAAEQVVRLLQATAWDRAQLARIRAVLAQLEEQLTNQEQERPEPVPAAAEGRRLGRGSLEAKLIRGYGPYLYYRFREGGRHRSVYISKVGSRARG
jgi:hypothetical protein